MMRLFGKRTLATMHAYDLVITVALGSLLARIILSKDVVLLEGLVGIILLMALQFALSWSSLRSPTVRKMIKAQPVVLLYRGQLLHDVMRRERVGEEEIFAALRSRNVKTVEQVDAVILENNGSLSVLTGINPQSALFSNIKNFHPAAQATADANTQHVRHDTSSCSLH
jgi:uncharacterized membrane protein YcaP (DUF421 family)